MYPMVNGLVWHSHEKATHLIAITNRASGILMKDTNSSSLEMFLTRQIRNVNNEWGLSSRLDDSMQT
jgi:molybdate-binding protein